MKPCNSNLDEMQEQKLLKIEHTGCWIAFWGLAGVLVVECFFFRGGFPQNILGEAAVFLLLAIYILVSCVKNGIWDRKLRPNPQTNLKVSLIASGITAVILMVANYLRYQNLVGALLSGVFVFVFTFALTFAAVSLASKICQKKNAKLEEQAETVEE